MRTSHFESIDEIEGLLAVVLKVNQTAARVIHKYSAVGIFAGHFRSLILQNNIEEEVEAVPVVG
jgi:hypothetical protein